MIIEAAMWWWCCCLYIFYGCALTYSFYPDDDDDWLWIRTYLLETLIVCACVIFIVFLKCRLYWPNKILEFSTNLIDFHKGFSITCCRMNHHRHATISSLRINIRIVIIFWRTGLFQLATSERGDWHYSLNLPRGSCCGCFKVCKRARSESHWILVPQWP